MARSLARCHELRRGTEIKRRTAKDAAQSKLRLVFSKSFVSLRIAGAMIRLLDERTDSECGGPGLLF
jgi:hypothetical protein